MPSRERLRHSWTRVRVRADRLATRWFGRYAWKVLWPGSEPVPVRFPPGHFHSPVPSTDAIHEATPSDQTAWGPDRIAGVDLRHEAQVSLVGELDLRPPSGPRWAPNSYFGAGDTTVYQAVLRRFRPPRVVEVGSGWSTAALLDVHVPEALTLVEPYPDRVRALLGPDDWARCTLIETRLQDVDPAVFAMLADGDVLFIDSTHVTKLGSDVNRLFFEILPGLAPGVLVHIHDVGYPFEYPGDWIREGWAWNEAYLLRAFLQYNGAFEILLWPDMLSRTGDLPDGYGSIWLRKVA